MTVCKPIALAVRYSDNIVKMGEAPNLDMFDIVAKQDNPADNFNPQSLLDITNALGAILPRTDTTKYPLVDSRYKQSPILYSEVADFLKQTGLNPEQVAETLKDFQTEINQSPLISNTQERIIPNTPSDVDVVLNQLEFYYSGNMALSISGGFCSAIANPFGKLLAALEALKFGGQLLDSLLSFSFDLDALLSPLTTLKATLTKIVDSLKETLKAQVDGIVKSAQAFVKSVKQGAKKILKKLQKMASNIKNFFEGDSMDKLKDKIGDFVQKSMDQFKEMTPETIALLLFRFCQFTEMIQNFMKSPVDALKNFAVILQTEMTVLKTVSENRAKDAVNAGAVRLDDDGIKEIKARIVRALNIESYERDAQDPGPRPEPEQYVASETLTDAENEALSTLGPDGMDGYFNFSPSVLNMGKSVSDSGPNGGFSEVRFEVWQKFTIVCRRMGRTMTVNSAYRSPEYNRRIGGASRSMHMSALALDVSMAGLSDNDIRNFIRIASQEGFLGIAYYSGSNFTHIDLGSRRSWNRGHRFDAYIDMHLNDGFRKANISSSQETTAF
jgi:hypothetical protein